MIYLEIYVNPPTMKNRIILLCSLLPLLGCWNRSSDDGITFSQKEASEMQAPEPLSPPPSFQESEAGAGAEEQAQDAAPAGEIRKKIIKDGEVRVEVENLAGSKRQVDTLLNQFEAYYENEYFNSSDYQSSYELKIRVPSDNFEALLSAIESGEGKVLSKNVTARDVTEEYVDLSIRLDNNREYLKRYNELLARANSVNDILEIQERTRRIEEEIDAKLGRLKYLDDQVNFSTLNLTLTEYHEVTAQRESRNFGRQVWRALGNGFDAFLDFLLLLVNLWPFLIILAVLWAFRKRIRALLKGKPGSDVPSK